MIMVQRITLINGTMINIYQMTIKPIKSILMMLFMVVSFIIKSNALI